MKSYTFWDKIRDLVFRPYEKVKWFFAKKWLDETFGEQEYWGDTLCEWRTAKHDMDNMKIAQKNNY